MTSLPNRLGSFVYRNKYRLIGSGVVVAGVWHYYKDAIKNAFALYKLVQQMSGEEPVLSVPPLSEGYLKTVATADETSQKHFQSIRMHLSELYGPGLDRVQSALKSGADTNRDLLFRELFELCFCRLICIFFVVHSLLLVARVEVCLIARDSADEDARQDHRELLSSLRVVGSRDSMSVLSSLVSKLVSEEFLAASIGPATLLKLDRINASIDRIVTNLANNVDMPKIYLGQKISNSHIVAETLDVLEAPQFAAILQFIIVRALHKCTSRSMPEGKELFAAALLLPGVRTEADILTGVNSVYLQLIRETPQIDEFCQSVYEAPKPQQDVSDQLGELLEKLVKTDLAGASPRAGGNPSSIQDDR